MGTLLRGLTLDNFAAVIANDDLAERARSFFGAQRFEDLWRLFHQAGNADANGRTVLLMPGILGSTLLVGTDRVWIDPVEIAHARGLDRLIMTPGAAPADDRDAAPVETPPVRAGTPLPEIYGPMASFLTLAGFRVVSCAVDWRRSIDAAADELAQKLTSLGTSVSIVGHSMGCLITRRCVQRHPETVDRIERAVFLAPPFRGSFEPLQVVSGQYIPAALIDLLVRPGEIARVFKTFPGLAEMAADRETFAGLGPVYDAATGPLRDFHPQLPARIAAFAKAFRRTEDDTVRQADAALMAKSSIVLTSTFVTVTHAEMEGATVRFHTAVHGDGVVPTRSLWDDAAKDSSYRSTWYHAIVPLEPAVIHGTAALLRSHGDHAGLLLPLGAMPEPAQLPFLWRQPSWHDPGSRRALSRAAADRQRRALRKARLDDNQWTLDDLVPDPDQVLERLALRGDDDRDERDDVLRDPDIAPPSLDVGKSLSRSVLVGGALVRVEVTVQAASTADTPETPPARRDDNTAVVTSVKASDACDVARAKWTVLVYMAGDNNLEAAGFRDLREMQVVGSTDDVRVVVQFDTEHDVTTRYLVEKGKSTVVETLPGIDCGDPKELTRFIRWGRERFPAERTALIVWNHGGGWEDHDLDWSAMRAAKPEMARRVRRAQRTVFRSTQRWLKKLPEAARMIAIDAGAQDYLDNQELRQAVADAGGVDLFGCDACLMNNLEVAYEMRDTARVMVGSEEEEPEDGWPYDEVLGALVRDPDMDASALAKLIVARYVDGYRAEDATDADVTQSALDLQRLTPLCDAVDALADALIACVDSDLGAIVRAQRDAISFSVRDYVDLGSLADRLAVRLAHRQGVVDAARRVREALTPVGTMLANDAYGDAVTGASGVSIFFPMQPSQALFAQYERLAFGRDHRWLKFLMAYFQ